MIAMSYMIHAHTLDGHIFVKNVGKSPHGHMIRRTHMIRRRHIIDLINMIRETHDRHKTYDYTMRCSFL